MRPASITSFVLAVSLWACGGHAPAGSSPPPDAGRVIDAGVEADGGTPLDAGASPDAGTAVHPATNKTFGGARPTTITVPTSYDNNVPTPLVMVLHGYGATGAEEAEYLGFTSLVNEAGVILVAPDGTVDADGNRFWNATDACCNFYGSTVDDDGYLTGLITAISAEWNIDPNRVVLFGHSNGGFMSYRMACNHADLIGAIGVLAGDTWETASKCAPVQPVSVLHVQGNADMTISYTGGTLVGVAYPGAMGSLALWAGYDHCTGALASAGANLDLESTLAGAETTVDSYTGCPTGIDLGLWTIQGGGHIPNFVTDFHTLAWQWLAAHPRQ